MIDTTTRKPLRVLTDGTVGPYIRLPFLQVAEVTKLLEEHGIRHKVEEEVISFDGGPEEAIIDLGRGADATAIQAILDSAR